MSNRKNAKTARHNVCLSERKPAPGATACNWL